MNNELLDALTILEKEKNISKETLLEAGNGSISYGGVKKRSISGRCGRCADLRRVPSGQNETSLPVARGDGGKVSAGRCGRCSGGYESTRYS